MGATEKPRRHFQASTYLSRVGIPYCTDCCTVRDTVPTVPGNVVSSELENGVSR